jgi:dCMP deaminase
MQITYTAKYNSGCISRQVGAVITDTNYSIKSVGWNNTPEGQTPCLLRNARDFYDPKKNNNNAYSEYERTDKIFNKELKNLQIISTASECPELRDMGTTACVLLVQDDKV